jgi:hypothetical protein
MKVYKKLAQARKMLKEQKIEKLGFNKFSNYKYFTPEQISSMVFDVSNEVGLFNKFDLRRTDLGLEATLTVFDVEGDQYTTFELATDIPMIKATNVAQQLGGCATYSERYLLQIAYDIKDNNLDFDVRAINADQQNYIFELIRNSTYDDDQKEDLYARVGELTTKEYNDAVANLQMNQLDDFDKNTISQKAINKKLNSK